MNSNSNSIDTIPEEPDEVSDPVPYYDLEQSFENNTETEPPPVTPQSEDEDKTEDISDLPREALSSLKLEMSNDSLTAVFYEDRSDASNLSRFSREENLESQSLDEAKETPLGKAPCDTCKFCRTIGDELLHNHGAVAKDVRLFQPYEVEQILLPDNANCLAVQTFLKMCNLEYTVDPRKNAEAMSPTGKVPFIKCGAFIIAELEGIVQFVGSKGISLTQDLSPENRADMRAYMTLVNNVLETPSCTFVGATRKRIQVTKPRYGSVYPWPLNHIQTWSKRSEETKRLKVLGWQQKTLEEVYNDVETCCQALTDRLDGNEYFYGSNYTELDALLYSHLYLLLTVPLPSHLGMVVRKYGRLVDYCRKIDREIVGRDTDLTPKTYRRLPARRVLFDEMPSARIQSQAHIKDGPVNVAGVVIN